MTARPQNQRNASEDLTPLLSKLSLRDLNGQSAPAGPPFHSKVAATLPSTSSSRKENQGSSTAPMSSSTVPIKAEKLADSSNVLLEIDSLATSIGQLLGQCYEIQELRHTSTDQPLDALLSSLESSISVLSPRIQSLSASVAAHAGHDKKMLSEAEQEIRSDWEQVLEQNGMLKEEMKEDGFLVRFRTAAEQAETMMETLQKSLIDCTQYLERITSSTRLVPYISDLDEQPSLKRFEELTTSHESLKKSYMQSLAKSLKMMDKSISERSTKNGETLRRYGDMNQRWIVLQKRLQQLDAKTRLVVSQHSQLHGHQSGDVEILVDASSPSDPTGPPEYFGYPSSKPAYETGGKRLDMSTRRTSVSGSSATSRVSYVQPTPQRRISSGSGSTNLTPESANLRRRPSISGSVVSGTTTRTLEKPRWNSSPRVVDTTSRRTSTYGYSQRAVSPSPSNTSVGSTFSRTRIPVPSPSALTSSPHRLLAQPQPQGTPQNRLQQARDNMRTPDSLRTRPSGIPFSSFQPRSTLSPVPNQRPLAGTMPPGFRRAPPSSFRSSTPTPSGYGRPSSRMSMVSMASLQPFQPSRYDLLDLEIERIIQEVKFTLFVSRLDPPLKKGQLKGDNEEWKGEYVFGAGERPTGVKLLKGGRGASKAGWKCLIRTGGAWVDLKGYLEKKMAATVSLDSP
ncbi:hypothetical protein P7C73_g3234, partial [Tremellales sp. Uapishka_1]